jgi:hypothetical protein
MQENGSCVGRKIDWLSDLQKNVVVWHWPVRNSNVHACNHLSSRGIRMEFVILVT